MDDSIHSLLLMSCVRGADQRYFLSPSVDIFGGQAFVFTASLYYLSEKKRRSRILSDMNAYVIVQDSVTKVRNMVYEKGPEIIYFHCSK